MLDCPGNSGVFPAISKHTASRKEAYSSTELPSASYGIPAGPPPENIALSTAKAAPFAVPPVPGMDSDTKMVPSTEQCASLPHELPQDLEGNPPTRTKICRFDGERSEQLQEQRLSSQAGKLASAAESTSDALQDSPGTQHTQKNTVHHFDDDQEVVQGDLAFPPETTCATHSAEMQGLGTQIVASGDPAHSHETSHSSAAQTFSSIHTADPQVCAGIACTECTLERQFVQQLGIIVGC